MVIYGGKNQTGVWYGKLVEEEIGLLVSQHIIHGEVIPRLMITPVDP